MKRSDALADIMRPSRTPWDETRAARGWNERGVDLPRCLTGARGVRAEVEAVCGAPKPVSLWQEEPIRSPAVWCPASSEARHCWYYVELEHGITRYTPTGALDTAFGSGGVLGLPPFTDVVSRAGGGFVAAVASGRSEEASILRLTSNWSPDATFGTNGSLHIGELASFLAMAVQADGRITITTRDNGTIYRRLP
jgi:beta-propeller uncharacterized protein DUF5122